MVKKNSLMNVLCPIGELLESAGRLGDEDKLVSPWLHFQGLGIGPSIPIYLRVNGNVCNLNFSKMECEVYVNDIWTAKKEYEEASSLKNMSSEDDGDGDDDNVENVRNNKIHLSDYFKIFLEVKIIFLEYTGIFSNLRLFPFFCCSVILRLHRNLSSLRTTFYRH